MNLQEIRRRYSFPDPAREEYGDLLAVGGDLHPERLIAAYSRGIFPWYDENSPILWWSPDPRLILRPEWLHIPRRLQRQARRHSFSVTVNTAFEAVIRSCAGVERTSGKGTWIVPEMIEAYIRLHCLGYAHSVETWLGKRLVGGIYGVALGRVFFGESMFYTQSNASKLALLGLMQILQKSGFAFLDCQQTTAHMLRFGARETPRRMFVLHVEQNIHTNPSKLCWNPGPIKKVSYETSDEWSHSSKH
ncbi:MAG: leucyl/phenylalanyl-tRNA--protein transferase [Desulfohalobiaceae bacterium]|nr:leucyl/phenylalanyl-tRNA--protein transferase [Desulfohalobiaceae bacterium]